MENAKIKQSKTSVIAGLVWMISFFAALLILTRTEIKAPLSVIVAIIPVLTFAYFLYSYAKAFAHMDELKKRIQFEAIATAFALGLLLLMVLFLLDVAGVMDYTWFGYGHMVLYFLLFYYVGFLRAKKMLMGK